MLAANCSGKLFANTSETDAIRAFFPDSLSLAGTGKIDRKRPEDAAAERIDGPL